MYGRETAKNSGRLMKMTDKDIVQVKYDSFWYLNQAKDELMN
jgi:hypothetical protein